MSLGRGHFLSHYRHLLLVPSRTRQYHVLSSTVSRMPVVQPARGSCPYLYPSQQSSVALFTTTSSSSSSSSSSNSSGSDQHALFLQQLQELEKERKQFFGEDIEQDKELLTGVTKQTTLPVEPSVESTSAPLAGEFELDMEELHAEREALFQFTADEKAAWTTQSTTTIHGKPFQARLSPQLFKDIEATRAAADAAASDSNLDSTIPPPPSHLQAHHESFSHVSNDSQSVHMVDVGPKQVTTRTARAQSTIRLPPEVIDAFQMQQSSTSSSSELVGPKGPIFATAKLAGIMAAKRTSDLIPLCHPLPLDQVQIDIRMSPDNTHEIIVECTCRVTHKTGVEMEALTGASVAALTIYDMVKAVSHRVEISSTKLLSKTGGKRNLGTETSKEK